VVPEDVHTLPMDGHWKFQADEGSQKPKFLKESMKLNWPEFLEERGLQSNKPSVEDACMNIFWTHT